MILVYQMLHGLINVDVSHKLFMDLLELTI